MLLAASACVQESESTRAVTSGALEKTPSAVPAPNPASSASSDPTTTSHTATPENHETSSPSGEPRMPGPHRARGKAAVLRNAECVGCHRDVAASWLSSRHASAFTNSAYQSAAAREPSAFCNGCHAPEATQALAPSPAEGALGVGCVSCHVGADETILAAARVSPTTEPTAPPGDVKPEKTGPHEVLRSPQFSASGACAGCHEFRFPQETRSGDEAFMQTTVREHARSPARERSCASCHMQQRDGLRSHSFLEVRDAAWVRSYLKASADQRPDGTVRITIAQTYPGHGFPTGDLFRSVEIGAALRKDGKELARDVSRLTRHWGLAAASSTRPLLGDTRLFYEPLEIDLTPRPGPLPNGATLEWWVTLQRVATIGGHPTLTSPAEASIESELTLWRETVKPTHQ